MDEKILDYMTKTEYASEYPGVVKNAEHADSATGSQFADNAIKLGGNESTYYASAASVTTLGETVNGVLGTANNAQAMASEAKTNAATADAKAVAAQTAAEAAKSTADNAQAKANACIPKSDITKAAGDFTTKVMSQKATTEQLNLCMKKADYDSDGDGVVERADHALSADNSSKLEGKTEAELSVANAAKLGGKMPNEYATAAQGAKADAAMPRGGGSFTGIIYAPEVQTQSLGNSGTPRLKSGDASQAVYLQGNSIQCTDYAGGALAPLNCGAITVSSRVSCGGNVSCNGVEAVSGMAVSTPGVPAIHAWNTNNWFAIRCNGGVVARDANDTAYTQMVAGAFNQQSSERFKDILAEMTLEQARKALDIDLIQFKYKAKYNDDGGKIHYGVKAEQLHELGLTDLVSYDKEGLPFSVDYSKLTPYLNGIVKDHEKRIEQLEAKAAKYDALSALLVKNGILTQGEIDGLEV